MPKVILRPLIAVVLAVLLASCAGMSTKLEPPRVQLLGIQVLSTDMFAQQFNAHLQIQNPNDVEVAITGLDFEVLLFGDRFAEGVSNDHFVLPALGEAEFNMGVTTSFVSSFGRLISRMGGAKLEAIEYEIVGTVFIDKGMVKKIPFNHAGTVDFAKAASRKKPAGTTL